MYYIIDGARIHLHTLNVVKDEAAGVARLTATVNKETNENHVTVAQIAYSYFPNVLEKLKECFVAQCRLEEELKQKTKDAPKGDLING